MQHKEMMEVGDKDEEQQDSSSLFAELEKTKKVFVEPATSRDMADLLLSFQQAVEDAYRGKEKKAEGQSGWRGGWEEIEGRDKSSRTVTGAILLAVCKGKAAEGKLFLSNTSAGDSTSNDVSMYIYIFYCGGAACM